MSEYKEIRGSLQGERCKHKSWTDLCERCEIDRLHAENASLAAWQCVYTDGKTGLVGDEHGNQYCAMAQRTEDLRAENERLRAALTEIARVTRGWEPGVWTEEEGRKYFAYLFFGAQKTARAALEGK